MTFKQKKKAQRQAFNSVIQGSAGDIMKSAMLELQKNITNYNNTQLKAKILLNIHDELVVECLDKNVNIISGLMIESMQNYVKETFNLLCTLEVVVKTGKSLATLEEYEFIH
eukprot:TRINITY_DN5441_c0_g2_i1.p1 TRINITY_DN5441_c0_g2~~TRINITY_DN5441_c0_g2_i1.p1  ORF type:complete len:112 (+),score=25.65 TRINITY_DN5441_c0_g2_i1:142-477(+)